MDIAKDGRLPHTIARRLRLPLIAAGLDPRTLPPRVSVEEAARNFGSKGGMDGPRRYKDIWSAGHSISGVTRVQSAAELVEQTLREYEDARIRTRAML